MDEDMMDVDHTVELDGDDFILASADQILVGCSPGHYRMRSGRSVAMPAARRPSQESGPDSAPEATGHRVRKKKPSRKRVTVFEDERQQQICDAIANGSYLIQVPQHSGSPFSTVQSPPEQLQRLTRELVIQALFDQSPGLTVPTPYDSGPFTSAAVDDLVGALEAYQIALAKRGNVILSSEAGELLKPFTRDVLRTFSKTKRRLQISFGDDELWYVMASSFHGKWLKRWLRGVVVTALKEDNAGRSGKTCRRVFNEAIETPGRHPQIDQVIGNAMGLGQPHYGHAVTLKALVQHFEIARAGYLRGINSSTRLVPLQPSFRDAASPNANNMSSRPLGNLLEQRDMNSSDEEDETLQDSGSESDIDDNIQVQGELLCGTDRLLIRSLDKWMELANHGKRQDNIDVDMLSALSLKQT